MIVVTISSHTVSCSQGGSAHLGVGVIAITTLCIAASSIAQELAAHGRMSKGTSLTLFTILTVTSHITLAGRCYFGRAHRLAWGVIIHWLVCWRCLSGRWFINSRVSGYVTGG